MTTKLWFVGLLLTTPVLAGCIGGSDDEPDAMEDDDAMEGDSMEKDDGAMMEDENDSPVPAVPVILALVAGLALALRRRK